MHLRAGWDHPSLGEEGVPDETTAPSYTRSRSTGNCFGTRGAVPRRLHHTRMADYKKVKDIAAVDAAWLAGLIDGEGTVTLSRDRRTAKFRTPTIDMTSTSPELLEEVVRLTGVGFITTKRTKAKEHHSQAWHWCVRGGSQVIALLKIVLPFMREKNKRARAVLLVEHYEALTPRNGQYTAEQTERKLELETRLLAITQRAG